MSMPLDDDGFLRRECPACEREFKVYIEQHDAGDSDAQSPVETEYYCYCPYCAATADPSAWFTKAQLDVATRKVMNEFVKPRLDDMARSFEDSPFVSVEVSRSDTSSPELNEINDMRRVDLRCHPDTPVKIADDHVGPVHCMICGAAATAE